MSGEAVHRVRMPAPLRDLLFGAPASYRVAYGGRGSAKSWSFAQALLVKSLLEPMTIVCAREIQKSIKDSVFKLLVEQAQGLGISHMFDYGQEYFRGKNGSEFIFKGLRSMNMDSIKSLEGSKICWVEEAQSVSKHSWEILTPTMFRRPGSEIWATFNPYLATDETYKRFVVDKPPCANVIKINYDQNPFFPEGLERERAHLERVDPEAYAHIWLGECRIHSDAQVFKGKWSVADIPDAVPEGADGPYYGADWGFAQDPTAIIRCYIHAGRLYITHDVRQIGCEIDALPSLFDEVPDVRKYVIRADSARPETISYMARQGFNIVGAKKGTGSIESGISWLRKHEEIIIHPRCRHLIDEFRLYSYKVDRLSGDVLPSIVDAHNHGIDALRYALEPLMKGGSQIFIGRAE